MANSRSKDFMDEFKLIYKEKGKQDLKAQIPYLSQLADRYKKLGEKDPREHWSDLLKAHTLYNSCAVRSYGQDREEWMQASYDVQKLYWGQEVKVTKKQVEGVTADIKENLESLRSKMRHKLTPILKDIETWQFTFESLESSPDEPEIPIQLCETIQDLSHHCNEAMIDIFRSVLDEAVGFCGKPPCSFSAIAFGSLAKGEATPYSDLEYLFLIKEQSADIMMYFERLAVTSYFIVGNVQETNLKYMSIDELRQDKWFVDAARSGLKIDGLSENAGNIPTGNSRPGTKKNRLILTPSELAKEYKDLLDNPATDQKQPGDLTDMLTYTREFYNHNNNNLLAAFRRTKSQYTPNKKRNKASRQMIQEDIKHYDFVPSITHAFTDSCINLKTDIYRYPSILIYDLKIIHHIDEIDTWKTLEALLEKRVISQQLYDCLLFLLCAAQYIRLSAYLYKNSQEDGISILLVNTDTDSAATYDSSWHLPQALFFRICLIMLPVKSHITMNLNIENGLMVPVKFQKYEAAATFYMTLQEYKAQIQAIQKQFPSPSDIDIGKKFDLAGAYYGLSDHLNSLKFSTEILDTLKSNAMSSDVQKLVTARFGNLDNAICHVSVLKASSLENCGETQQAMDIFKSIEGLPMRSNLQCYYNFQLAILFSRHNQTSLAFKCPALTEESGQSENTIDMVLQHLVRARLYISIGKINGADETSRKALELTRHLYGPGNPHTLIGQTYNILSKIAIKKERFSEAQEFHSLAKRNIGSISDRPLLRRSLDFTSAELMMSQGDYVNALRTFLNLLLTPIEQELSQSQSETNSATINFNIGKCYLFAGKIQAAEFRFKNAKALYMKLFEEDGSSKTLLGNMSEADLYIAQCLFKRSFGKEALVTMEQCIANLYHLVELTPFHIPGYFLSNIDRTLTSIIQILIEKEEFIESSVTSALSCLYDFCRIHALLEKRQGLHPYYSNEVE